jgi:hypothetical protein
MAYADKLEAIRVYLAQRFPACSVQVADGRDADFRDCFLIDSPEGPAQSRRLRIPGSAIDDLDPSEIIALLERQDVEPRWRVIGPQPLDLAYDVAGGLDLVEPPP